MQIHKEAKVTGDTKPTGDIGRVVKAIAIIEGVLSIVIAIVLLVKTGGAEKACLTSYGDHWDCLQGARAMTSSMLWLAAGWSVGGVMAAIVIYCIGHIASQMDENNRLMRNLYRGNFDESSNTLEGCTKP